MNYITGVDISAWQNDVSTPKNVDFIKMKEAGAAFIFMRAFFGVSKDRDFDYYWKTAKSVGLPRGAYMFPITTVSITEQANIFVNLLKPDRGEISPVIDVETYRGSSLSIKDIKNCVNIVENGLGVSPIIYTGYYVWREIVGSNDPFFKKYLLWIATYSTKPMIPPPWTEWIFWQATDKGDGAKYGVESKNIDVDYFNGTQDDFNKIFGTDIDPIDPIPVDPTTNLEYTTLSAMNVRTGPGINFPVSTTILEGTKIIPLDIGGKDSWIKIAENMWVCKSLNGKNYLV